MITRTFHRIAVLLPLVLFSIEASSGYRTYLDPRSMAMGGTGVAAATKFNASHHNPALIAFNKGDKPDKIYISASQGLTETYGTEFEDTFNAFNSSNAYGNFVDVVREDSSTDAQIAEAARQYREVLRDVNLVSYRKDETLAFSVLADTRPITINFYTRNDYREMVAFRNRDEVLLGKVIDSAEDPDVSRDYDQVASSLRSEIHDVSVEISEFGATVATTNVIDYNIPISWGFTPKVHEIRGSHRKLRVENYDLQDRPEKLVNFGLIEWNLDIGFAALLTDDFLRDVIGLDGWWLDGEWVFGAVGMNLFPTDFRPYYPPRNNTFGRGNRAIQANYQLGIAHYRERYMLTLDLDLNEAEVYDFEGMTRFLSFGSEYYWRDDFHLRGGVRFNLSQTSEAGQDKALLTGGILYQPRGFSIEAAAVFNDVEKGGSLGFGLAF